MKNRIRQERKRLGFTQKKLAVIAGVSEQTQVNYEKGKYQPNSEYLSKLVALGFDLNVIISGERNESMLTPNESLLLKQFREADSVVQDIVFKVLGDTPIKDKNDKTIINQQSSDNHGTIIGVGRAKK